MHNVGAFKIINIKWFGGRFKTKGVEAAMGSLTPRPETPHIS